MDQWVSKSEASVAEHAGQMLRPVAIFDLDRTITTRGSYTPFLLFASARLCPWRLLAAPAVPVFMLAYKAGLISRTRLKEKMLGLFLGPVETWRLTPVLRNFVARYLRRYLRREARAAIREERRRGARLVLATASFDFYANLFAEALGFEDVVATRSTERDGMLLPKISGENCYGPEKLAMIERHLQARGIVEPGRRPTFRFYSDDRSDLPCLLWADHGIVVSPKRSFAAEARSRGLPVVEWR